MGRPALEVLLATEPARAGRDQFLARVPFEAVWERDLRAQTLRWTGGLSMFGYAPEEVVDDLSWLADRIHPDDREGVLARMAAALGAPAATWSGEYRFRRDDGSWAWVASREVIERDPQGRAVGAVGAMIDVSRMKEMEERLRLFAEQVPARIGASDRELRILWDIGAGFGQAGKFAGKSVAQIFDGSPDRERILAANARVLAGEACDLEVEICGRTAALKLKPFRDPADQIVGVIGVALDITERAGAERALQRSERLLKLVLDTLPVGVVVVDRQGDILLSNEASGRIWGANIASGKERWARSRGVRRDTGRVIGPGEWASARAISKGETSLNELIDIEALDGRRKTIQNSAVPVRDSGQSIIGAVIVNEDVTEWVRAEEALRRGRQLLVDAERLGHTGSWEMDVESGAVLNSAENQRLFFGDDRSKGAQFEDFASAVHPEDRERVMRRREELFSAQGSPDIEFRVVWPDGSVHWIFGRATVVRDEQGRPLRVYGTNADVTERKNAEQELERRLDQHAAVAQLSQSALRSGELQPLFEKAVDLLARSSALDFAEVAQLMPDEELLLRAAHGWKEGLAGHARLPGGDGSLCAFTIGSGAPGVVEDFAHETRFSVAPIILEQGIVSHVTVLIKGDGKPFGTLGGGTRKRRAFSQHDINFFQALANVLASAVERERAAGQLHEQREQMQALSRKLIAAQEAERRAVARELHDDFGQVLTAIKLNLQRRERDQGESIALVDGAIARMRDLAQDLRPPLLDELGLESSLRWYVEREARRAGLEFHLDLQPLPARPSAEVETTSFRVAQEALTNVIRHAQARSVRIELNAHGAELILAVRDDGRGFGVAEARKRAARGASQGLLSMQERVALAGGELQIDSAPGRGTTVRARLPCGGAAR